jgi:hypothetical protein
VRGGDGDGSVDVETTSREIHHGRGNDSEIKNVSPSLHGPPGEALEEHGRGNTGIASDSEALATEKVYRCPSNRVRILLIKITSINTPNIVGLENLCIHSGSYLKTWHIIPREREKEEHLCRRV